MSPCSSARDWYGSVKENVSVEKGIRHRNRIGMSGRNDIRARGEILGVRSVAGKIKTKDHDPWERPCAEESH